jgi:hypothetical protein
MQGVEWAGLSRQLAVSGEPGSSVLTVGEFLRGWLVHVRERVRASTHDGYESLVRCHALPGLGTVALVELGPLHLQDLYGRLLLPAATGGAGLSAGSVRNLHLVLGQAFGQAVRWRLIASSPALGAQPPRAQATSGGRRSTAVAQAARRGGG